MPIRAVAIMVTVGVASVHAGAAQVGTVAPPLVFDKVTVIDVEQGHILPEQRVVVIGHRILATGAASAVEIPKGARVVDAHGKYLIPGIWDMHFHSRGLPLQPFYSLLVANGITGIRDPLQMTPLDTVLRFRSEIAAGDRVGPRQVVTGGGLGDRTLIEDRIQGGGVYAYEVLAATPADARRAIDSLHQAGAEFIKTHGDPSRETFFAMIAEVKRLGIRLEGHLPTQVSIAEASDSGMRVIDHLIFVKDRVNGVCDGEGASLEKCAALAARLRRNGTWIQTAPLAAHPMTGPDIAVRSNLPYLPDSLRQMPDQPETIWCPTLALMARADMPLLSGTDAGAVGGLGWLMASTVHEELIYAVGCGVTPLRALQTVTLEPARYLRGTDSLGTVAAGKLADLVLLDANPLDDIANTTKISAVVANGRYFDRAALDALLADVTRTDAELRKLVAQAQQERTRQKAPAP